MLLSLFQFLFLAVPTFAKLSTFTQLRPATRYVLNNTFSSSWPTFPYQAPLQAIIHHSNKSPGVHFRTENALLYCSDIYSLDKQEYYSEIKIDNGSDAKLIALQNVGSVALVSPDKIQIYKFATKINTINLPTGSTGIKIYDIEISNNILLIASSNGLSAIDISVSKLLWTWSTPCSFSTSTIATTVFAVTCTPEMATPATTKTTSTCMLSTDTGDQPGRCVAWFHPQTPVAIHHEFSIGLIDATPVASSFTNTNWWIATNRSLNSYTPIDTDPSIGLFQRFAGGPNNLPAANITSMATTTISNTLVAGTSTGLVILKEGKFDFLTGSRWLTTLNGSVAVTFVAIADTGCDPDGNCTTTTILAGTAQGVSVITMEASYTLVEKANHFQNMIKRHIRPVTGIVADLSLQKYGDLSSANLHQPDDNSGLWTENYMVSQIFKYAVTGEKAAQTEALNALNTLENLVNVTGVNGFIARTMVDHHDYINRPNDHWGWNLSPSPMHPNWWFIANTSSDEITGHMYGLGVMATLGVNSLNEQEQQRAIHLMQSLLTRIVTDGLVVRDITGLPSRWGHWDPTDLNTYRNCETDITLPCFSDERGVNSLQILSFLAVGMKHSTSTSKAYKLYSATAFDLINATNRFHFNLLNLKMTTPTELGDNSLEFRSCYMLASSCGWGQFNSSSTMGKNDLKTFCIRLKPYFDLQLSRAFRIVSKIKAPLFNIIFRLSASQESLKKYSNVMDDAVETLREYPMELIEWPFDTKGRLDLYVDPEYLPVLVQSSSALPRHQSASLRWCENIFLLKGGSGMAEEDPTFWLESYWMGSYYSLLY